MNGTKVSMKILLIVSFLILSAAVFSGMALGYETDSGDDTLNQGEHTYYTLDMPDGGGVSYSISVNSGVVNVLFMDAANFALYSAGSSDVEYIDADYDITISLSKYFKVGPGTYYLVVENNASGVSSFSYDVKYGSDYNPSMWDMILSGGLMSMGLCALSAIVLIIWIFVLVWVYKDAKKRGKSGLVWVIIVFFFSIIGLIVWLLVRPPVQQPRFNQPYQQYQPQQQYSSKKCPSCGMDVDPNWNTCPNCGARLR